MGKGGFCFWGRALGNEMRLMLQALNHSCRNGKAARSVKAISLLFFGLMQYGILLDAKELLCVRL